MYEPFKIIVLSPSMRMPFYYCYVTVLVFCHVSVRFLSLPKPLDIVVNIQLSHNIVNIFEYV